MKNNSLITNIEQAFSQIKKPSIIYTPPIEGVTGERLAIQQDFGGLLRTEMSNKQCSMAICDSSLISDEALCYFLPTLANYVLQERSLGDLLSRRLEIINNILLNQDQKAIINCLIITLKELEKELEKEEELELKQSWVDWENDRIKEGKMIDKFLLVIASGNIDEVKKLIKQGANVNEKDNEGNLPIDIAKYKGHREIVELLIKVEARE